MFKINLSRIFFFFLVLIVIHVLQKKKNKLRKEACGYDSTPGAWNTGNPVHYLVATKSPASMS